MTLVKLKTFTTPELLDLITTQTGNAYTKTAAVILERMPRWGELTSHQHSQLQRVIAGWS